MTSRSLILCAVLLTAGLTTRCGDDDGGGGIALQDVEEEYLRLMCDLMVTCDTGFAVLFPTVPECVDFAMEQGDTGEIEAIVALVDSNRIQFSSSSARKCLDDMRAMGCDAMHSPEPASCRDVFQGSGAENDACRVDDECASGWCDTRASCPGECAQPVGPNGDCSQDEACEWGLVCVGGVCVTHPGPLGDGAPCEPGYEWCAYEYYCNPDTESCTIRKQVGVECRDSADECVAGSVCLFSECTEIHLVSSAGEGCDPYEGTLCDGLTMGLVCVFDFSGQGSFTTCEHGGSLGDTCVDMEASVSVDCDPREPIYCDRDGTQTCVSKKVVGQPCESEEECLSDYCNEFTGECDDPAPEACWAQ